MLLVKSKELKSSNRSNLLNSFKTGGYLLFLLSLHSVAWAQDSKTAPDTLTNPSSLLSIFLSLMLVIAIIFALAYIMRRFNVTQAGNGQMKVVASLMAGAKEKVMVIEVAGEQHLIGVTTHNINHLAKLEQHLEGKPALSGGDAFKDKLVQAMAQGIVGKKSSASPSQGTDKDASVSGKSHE